ncbi:hypothetical protein [Streptomyces sp. NPDC001480]|uniref:hypothetical protein n=1 Tax=Streptomyces sp. NPDC001480 TaxID=3364577 RepID=UPI00369E388E
MSGPLDTVPDAQRALLRPAPAGAGRLFERKLDGVRLLSRTGQRLDATCPDIAGALAARECDDFTVDGEVVAFAGGRTDSSRCCRPTPAGAAGRG